MRDQASMQVEIEELERKVEALVDAIAKRFLGQRDVVELLLFALFAEGHVLLEGAPGLGKTTLATSLATALELSFRRIQFTPDLMPADILGTRILTEDEAGRRTFAFHRGPVFCHVLLADEINRATPRTQSALLEAMQERQVTIFNEALPLERPFFVIATQNPIEMEGTYPLPEAQVDRFLLKIDVKTPELGALEHILRETTGAELPELCTVMTRDALVRIQRLVREVPVSSDIVRMAARIVLATHPSESSAPENVRRWVRYGASPRGGQALLLAAKARALLRGRLFVSVEDLVALAPACLRHRIILNYEGQASLARTDDLIAEVVDRMRTT